MIYKKIYLISLALGVITLLVTIATVFNLLSSIEENAGNGGAFLAALSMGIVILGISVTTVFGVVSGSVVYIYKDSLPRKNMYKLWWPLLISLPGLLGIIFMLKASVTNAL
ncbi:hypothetical protein ACFL3P_01480 [Pseudomonadota bacterium]